MKFLRNKNIIILIVSLIAIPLFTEVVLAVWDGFPYDPGETLDPECTPSQVDCDVTSPLTASAISDAIYGAGWNGDTTHAPSKNAVYDKIETLGGGHDPVTLAGTPDYITIAGQVITRNKLDLADDLNTFTSTALAGLATDETGSGALVFANSPSFTTPNIGNATGNITGNAGTATALVANGTNCSANEAPRGVDASGNAENCTAYLSGNQTITLSGDVSGSGSTAITTTLATVNSNTGTWGSATQAPQFTVNGKGLITAASNVTITPAVGSITGLGTGVATFLATPSSANLASAVTDETGSGALVFGTSPSFTTSIITPKIDGSTSASGTLTLESTSHATKGKIYLGADSVYDEANKSLTIGSTTTYHPLTVLTAPQASAGEILAGFAVSDTLASDFLLVRNGIDIDGTFAPQLYFALTSSPSYSAANITANINAATDSGTTPVTRFESRRADGPDAPVVTRPTFGWYNYATEQMLLDADGTLTLAGPLGKTGDRISKGWFTDLEVTNPIAGSITGNAATVTTNANLTGPITSVGNATSVASQTGTGSTFVMQASPTLTTPNLGTPSAAILTNATGLPISTGVSGLGTGVATFLGTPSSANLASALTDETGSGVAVFGTNPSLTTPIVNTSLTLTDDDWIGLGSSAGLVEFDDQSTDEVNILNANVGIGSTSPEALLEIQGVEATDAVLALDADDGDDNADTWFLKSLDSDNSLSISNHTTEVFNLTSAGALAIDGALTASNFSGSSSGTNTGDQTNITGNAATATALQTARTINGVSFDGTANITVTAAAGTLTGTTLNSSVVTSSLTSVGALNSGSITSGFGAIDLGADSFTTTGTVSTDTLTLTNTGTLNGVDVIDAATESTIESAIDTLANLTSVQGQAVSLSGSLSVPSAASVSGTNTGDVTLAGTPDYITISGQTITRNKLDLADDLNTFTSSALAGLVTDETGSGALVFGTSPSLATPTVNTSLTLTDDDWIGLGSSAGLIEFDDQSTDEVNILNANVGIGTATPGALLDVSKDLGILSGGSTTHYGIKSTPSATYNTDGNGSVLYGGYFAPAGYDNGCGTQCLIERVVGLYATASGGVGNYAAIFEGNVGIGSTNPEALLEIQGAETADAVLALDADDGDDNADTWFLKSLASDNSLSILNHTTEVFNLTSAGALAIDGALTASNFSGSSSGTNTGNVTLAGTPDYITISGQTITRNKLDLADDLNTFASSALAGLVTDETGSGALVFGTTPTFTTSLTSPLIIGGTGTTDDLILRTTSGVGASGADMIFQVGNNGATEAMRILNNGFVGIGTTTPGTIISTDNSSFIGRALNIYSNTSGLDTRLILQGNDSAKIDLIHLSGAGSDKWMQMINTGGSLTFRSITDDAGSLVKNNILVLKNGTGNVGIGTSSPGSKLEIENTAGADDVLLLEDSSGLCEAQPTTTGLTWSCSSDARLKTDIRDASPVLSYIAGIPLRDYTVIATGENVTGPIAQELLETNPELVRMDNTGFYQVSELSPWLITKGIQELDLKLESVALPLETENDSFVERFFGKISQWLADATNDIAKIFTRELETEKLCVSDESGDKTCITKAQLDALLSNAGQANVVHSGNSDSDTDTTEPDSTGSPEAESEQEQEEQTTVEAESENEPETLPEETEASTDSAPEPEQAPAEETPPEPEPDSTRASTELSRTSSPQAEPEPEVAPESAAE